MLRGAHSALILAAFDNVWEAAEVNCQFLFARLVFFQRLRPPEPPPLNLLKIPITLLALFLIGVTAALPAESIAHHYVSQFKDYMLAGFEYSSIINIAKELNAGISTDTADGEAPPLQGSTVGSDAVPATRQTEVSQRRVRRTAKMLAALNLRSDGEYVGTTFEGRNSFNNWKTAVTLEGLCKFGVDFIVKREDESAQEERWRSRMSKRMAVLLERQEARIVEKLERLHVHVEAATAGKLSVDNHMESMSMSA
jgi:hypothetical protein